MGDFTRILASYQAGEPGAQGRMLALIYADLRRLAHRHMSDNRWIATLSTTALVNESYLRLVSPAAQHVASRAHFMNLAAVVMRQIACDYARKRLREREHVDRGADVDLAAENVDPELHQARQFVALDEALNELARTEERQARVIECRFFAGMSEEETAAALGTSLRTVQREWNAARKWLGQKLDDV